MIAFDLDNESLPLNDPKITRLSATTDWLDGPGRCQFSMIMPGPICGLLSIAIAEWHMI